MMQTSCVRPTAAPFAASKVAPRVPRAAAVRCMAAAPPHAEGWAKRCAAGAAAALGSLLMSQAAFAGDFTYDELQALSYLEVKGSGKANQCPTVGADAEDGIKGLQAGTYSLDKFCMEPSSFKVKPVGMKEFEPSTLLTRNTYSLDQMSGQFTVGKDGTVRLQEDAGIDFAPTTVKLRGGVMVPFMFTVKGLDVQGPAEGFAGGFDVPSYRGATFMDPQGRGAASGWDYVKGLQGAGAQDALEKENIKTAEATRGEAAFAVSKVDPVTREVVGVFITRQLADDDLGSKDPAEIMVEGVWYGQLS